MGLVREGSQGMGLWHAWRLSAGVSSHGCDMMRHGRRTDGVRHTDKGHDTWTNGHVESTRVRQMGGHKRQQVLT